METIREFFQQWAGMRWTDFLDILIVAVLLYKLLPLFRNTGTLRVALTVIGIIVVAWLTDVLHLYALNFILSQFVQIGLIALVVLFQPELRRMLDHLGHMKVKNFFGVEKNGMEMESLISQTVRACEVMSREKVGALIVFTRDNRLDEQVKTGTAIEAQVSEQLIRNIFFPKAALHDGAMIIRDNKIAAAGCVLPLSESNHLSADLGTRHRAGVGMSEASDAVIVIVSEETGTVSVAVSGMLKRHLAPQTLERLLLNELCPNEKEEAKNLVVRLRQKLNWKGKEKQ